MQGQDTSLSTVQIAGQPPINLGLGCLPYSPEYKSVNPKLGMETTRRLAGATGGQERVKLAGICQDFPKCERLVSAGPWLIVFAIVVFSAEIIERRTDSLSLIIQGRRPGIQRDTQPLSRKAKKAEKKRHRNNARVIETHAGVTPSP